MTEDARQRAASTERNREAILEVLSRVLPDAGTVLEVGAGAGEHAVYCAEHLTGIVWQPSDPDAAARESIAAWVQDAHDRGVTNVRPPLDLDVLSEHWPVDSADAIVSINVIHISPWEATLGLLRGAGRVLSPGGILYLYGPFKLGGEHTADSNASFEKWLQDRDPRFGVRNLEDVVVRAALHELDFSERVEMPANNQSVIFRKPVPGELGPDTPAV